MDSIIDFGSVVYYNEIEYVFLAETEEIIYLARILNKEDTKKILEQYKKVYSTGSKNTPIRLQNPLYSFIELKTDQFRDRIAHLNRTDQSFDSAMIFRKICDLLNEDKRDLKKEILRETSAVPRELKTLIKKITLQ